MSRTDRALPVVVPKHTTPNPETFFSIYSLYVDTYIENHTEDLHVLSTIGNIWTTDSMDFIDIFKTFLADVRKTLDSSAVEVLYLPSPKLFQTMSEAYNGYEENNERKEWLAKYNTEFLFKVQNLFSGLLPLANNNEGIAKINAIFASETPVIPPKSAAIFEQLTEVIKKEVEEEFKVLGKRKFNEEKEKFDAQLKEHNTINESLRKEIGQLRANLEKLQKYRDEMVKLHTSAF